MDDPNYMPAYKRSPNIADYNMPNPPKRRLPVYQAPELQTDVPSDLRTREFSRANPIGQDAKTGGISRRLELAQPDPYASMSFQKSRLFPGEPEPRRQPNRPTPDPFEGKTYSGAIPGARSIYGTNPVLTGHAMGTVPGKMTATRLGTGFRSAPKSTPSQEMIERMAGIYGEHDTTVRDLRRQARTANVSQFGGTSGYVPPRIPIDLRLPPPSYREAIRRRPLVMDTAGAIKGLQLVHNDPRASGQYGNTSGDLGGAHAMKPYTSSVQQAGTISPDVLPQAPKVIYRPTKHIEVTVSDDKPTMLDRKGKPLRGRAAQLALNQKSVRVPAKKVRK